MFKLNHIIREKGTDRIYKVARIIHQQVAKEGGHIGEIEEEIYQYRIVGVNNNVDIRLGVDYADEDFELVEPNIEVGDIISTTNITFDIVTDIVNSETIKLKHHSSTSPSDIKAVYKKAKLFKEE